MDPKKPAEAQEPSNKPEEVSQKTPVRPGKGVKRKYQSPNTGGKQDDGDKSGAPRKRRKSTSATPLSRVGSPSTLLKPPLTERQQMALLLQMTDPNKQGSSALEETPTRADSAHSTPRTRDSAHSVPRVRDSTPRSRVQRRNERGETPLHMASIKGDGQTAVSLIEQGASVNATDHAGWTPLHEASNYGHSEVVALLLQHGAEPNAPGMDGDTPLHDAVINAHLETVKVLLKHGANPAIPNDKGITPLDVCKHDQILQLLRAEHASSTAASRKGTSEGEASAKPKPTKSGSAGGSGRVRSLKTLSQKRVRATEEEEVPLPPSSSSSSCRPDTDSDLEGDVFPPSKGKTEPSALSTSTVVAPGTPTGGRKCVSAPPPPPPPPPRGAMSYSDISSSESESELMDVVAGSKRSLKLHSYMEEVSEGKEEEEEEEEGDMGSASDTAKEVFVSEGEQPKDVGNTGKVTSPSIAREASSLPVEVAAAKSGRRPVLHDQPGGGKGVSSKLSQQDDAETESESDVDIDTSPPDESKTDQKPLLQDKAAPGDQSASVVPGSPVSVGPDGSSSSSSSSRLLVSVPRSLLKVLPVEGIKGRARTPSCASEGGEEAGGGSCKDSKVQAQASIDDEAEGTVESAREQRFVVAGPEQPSEAWTHRMVKGAERRDSTSSQDSRSSDKQQQQQQHGSRHHSRKPQHVYSYSRKSSKEGGAVKSEEGLNKSHHAESGGEEADVVGEVASASAAERDDDDTMTVSVSVALSSKSGGAGKGSTAGSKELKPTGNTCKEREQLLSGASANAPSMHSRASSDGGIHKSRIKELQCEEDIDESESKSTIVSLPTSLPIVFSRPPTTTLPPSNSSGSSSSSGSQQSSSKQPSAGYLPPIKDTLMTPPSLKPKALAILESLRPVSPQKKSMPQLSSATPSKDAAMEQESTDEISLPPKKCFRGVQRSTVIQQRQQQQASSPVSVPSLFSSFLTCTHHYRSDHIPSPTNPKSVYPPLNAAMCKLFSEQETERVKLAAAHLAEQDRLTLSLEQELLRAHQRASKAHTPISACALLLERLLPMLQSPVPAGDGGGGGGGGGEAGSKATGETGRRDSNGSKKESSESAVDGRLLAGLVQDVWDKCHQQKLSLLSRQKHEAEALLVVQRAQWIDHLTKTGSVKVVEVPDTHLPFTAALTTKSQYMLN